MQLIRLLNEKKVYKCINGTKFVMSYCLQRCLFLFFHLYSYFVMHFLFKIQRKKCVKHTLSIRLLFESFDYYYLIMNNMKDNIYLKIL